MTINLRKSLLKLRLWWYTNYRNKRVVSYSIPQQLRLFAGLLTTKTFKDYKPQQVGRMAMVVPKTDLYQVNQWLEQLTGLILAGEVLPKELVQFELGTISADRFLSCQDGYFVDPAEQVLYYRKLALEYADAIESLGGETDGIEGYNLRVTAPITEVIRILTYTLLEVDAS